MGFWNWFKRREQDEVAYPEPTTIAATGGRRMSAQTGATLPQFQESASGVGRSPSTAPMRFKMRTSFTPSQPVSNVRMFAGRRKVLRSIIRAIEDQQLHVVLYGDRGIGKTSTLHVLSHLAREARYLVRYTSCSEASDFSETFRAIANDIPLIYHSDTDPTSAQAETGGTLSALLPSGPLSVSQIADTFSKLTGVRVLIILDEFDRSDPLLFRRWVAELIKNLSDRSTRVQIVVAGVASNLAELVQYIPSIRRNIVGVAMPTMARDEIEELIRIGSETSGLPYSDEALHAIVDVANGSPYVASLLGQHAGVAALDRASATVEFPDVVSATDQAIEEVEGRLSPSSRQQIDAITDPLVRRSLTALGGAALHRMGEVDDTVAAGLDDSVRAAIEDLAKGGTLLEPSDALSASKWHFREDGVALYLWLRGARDRLHTSAS